MRGREGYDFLSLGLLGASFVTPTPAPPRLFGFIFCRHSRGSQGFLIVFCKVEVVFLSTGVRVPRIFDFRVSRFC